MSPFKMLFAASIVTIVAPLMSKGLSIDNQPLAAFLAECPSERKFLDIDCGDYMTFGHNDPAISVTFCGFIERWGTPGLRQVATDLFARRKREGFYNSLQ
jgi:hypothetical protein